MVPLLSFATSHQRHFAEPGRRRTTAFLQSPQRGSGPSPASSGGAAHQRSPGRRLSRSRALQLPAFGWMVRRHLNVLDSEHVLAFAIGVAVSRRFAAPKSTFAWRLASQWQGQQFAFVNASALVALAGASIAEAVPRERPKFS